MPKILGNQELHMAQNGFCLKDIYLLNGINYLCRTRAPMWVFDGL